MPNSHNNSPLSRESVRSYLGTLLPQSELKSQTLSLDYPPLLFLQTSHTMAAFGFSNGDMEKSYDAIYRGFKAYYSDQRGAWDALDLAFVFCVRPDVPDLDRFCSRVETDVYFCRKFVVPLSSPLELSLARLPFLPLTPLTGLSLRPPSAQTFLQQCGVPAGLARNIVVGQVRSPEGIVEDCITGDFGAPRELHGVKSPDIPQHERSSDFIPLAEVAIKNFRAYRSPQVFTLGSAVTVLYGPNGFGKTSFFDAVDFAATGEIGRIKSSSEAHFHKVAQHLDSKSEESVVSLSFRREGVTKKITRDVRDRKQALLDGRRVDRKIVLAELTGGDSPATDRVENFVSLFRATHLFNQEQPELTKDFQEDCRLPEDIVARMLAFEDYASAANKAARVCSVLQARIADANAQVSTLTEQAEAERKEFERLSRTAHTSDKSVEVLQTEVDSLRHILDSVGIASTHQNIDVGILRGWRAAIEARLGESQSRSNRFLAMIPEVGMLPRMRTQLTLIVQEIDKKSKAQSAADKSSALLEPTLKNSEQVLAGLKNEYHTTQASLTALEWLKATLPLYMQSVERQFSLQTKLNQARENLAMLRSAEDETTDALRKQESLATQTEERIKLKRQELSAVEALGDSIVAWQAARVRIRVLDQSEKEALESLDKLKKDENTFAPQLAALTDEEARMVRLIGEADRSQTELKGLLSQLSSHVDSGICPVCGVDHGSKDILIKRIQAHIAVGATQLARADLNSVRERASALSERIAGNKRQQTATESHLVDLRGERAALEADISRFPRSAFKLEVIVEQDSPPPLEQVQARGKVLEREIEEASLQLREIASARGLAREQLAERKLSVATRSVEIKETDTALSQLKQEISRFENDPKRGPFSFKADVREITDADRKNREHLADLQSQTVKTEADVARIRAQLNSVRQELAELQTELASLRSQSADVQSRLAKITGQLEEFKLPPDASESTLQNLIGEESRSHAQLVSLRDSLSSLELAIDAATTSAALTQLHQNIRNKERSIDAALTHANRHQPWLKYFEEISKAVVSKQNEAIADFTSEYGPRTSIIQRRLRSIYGFDDIEISSRESTISVRVRRRGEELRPTDYFSQSQQQTLFLGLFLTACISQTWSAFSPVFLDDPVTHFDDLNTYAFLDLIVGLLESNVASRQFIISTCDEKLLQLSRQKFRHFGEAAKFYRFTAIGPVGPVVEEILST